MYDLWCVFFIDIVIFMRLIMFILKLICLSVVLGGMLLIVVVYVIFVWIMFGDIVFC